MADRWGSLKDLADYSGLALRTLQYLRKQEPGVLVERQRGGRTQFNLGACNAALRRREAEKAKAEAKRDETIADAERRKAVAEASLAEEKLAQVRRQTIPLELHLTEVEQLLQHFRATLMAHPKTRDAADEILTELQEKAPPELDDEPVATAA